MSRFKPLLAGTVEESQLDSLTYPLILSPKLDGIRCLIWGGRVVSRKLKPIPNRYIQECLKGLPDGLDGEIMVEGGFKEVQSAVMSEDGTPNFTFHVFDIVSDEPYGNRLESLPYGHDNPRVKTLEAYLVGTPEGVLSHHSRWMEQGHEGTMLRDPSGPYKFGRSTLKQQILLKLKNFKDMEATVVAFKEKLHNTNEKKTDNLGHTERSSSKKGKVGMKTLGSLICKDEEGRTFSVGTGFTDVERQIIWDKQREWTGATITVKYQELTPAGVPRFPVFLGRRKEYE